MAQPEPQVKPVLFRLPENYIIALDKIVEHSKGKYKSRNDLVSEVIGIFLADLKRQADEAKSRG
jgi:hypothetical protein